MHHVYRIDKPSAWPAQLCPVRYTRNSCLWKTMDLAAIGPDAQCWNTENFLMKHTTHDASLPTLGSTIPPASSFPSKSLLPSLFPSCSCQLHPTSSGSPAETEKSGNFMIASLLLFSRYSRPKSFFLMND